MEARWILAIVGAVFGVLATLRLIQRRAIDPAARAWLIVAGVFLVTALWLSVR